MKKVLYLMRHGQTLFNSLHKIQGWCDSPLTPLGIKQAQIAGKYFTDNNIKFDGYYCSTSERASDTLELVVGNDKPYKRLKGLKEWNFGRFEAQDEFLNPKLPYGDFFVYYGGESQSEVQNRMVETIKDIMEKENSTVLAVSHGGAIANFFRAWSQYSKVQMEMGIGNCSIFKFEYENGIFCCVDIIKHDFSSLEAN